jgi:hypothetical protein
VKRRRLTAVSAYMFMVLFNMLDGVGPSETRGFSIECNTEG